MLAMSLLCSQTCHGEVQVYVNFAEWQAALTSTTTIGFTGFQDGMSITNEYAGDGVTFASPSPFVLNGFDSFPNDGSGIVTNSFIQQISAEFSSGQYGIATHFSGAIQFSLLFEGQLVYESDPFGVGSALFVGLVTDIPFDRVILFDPVDPVVVIDDLHFGVPAPGILPLLALAGIIGQRRRSRGR
jgi:hypothetical protein